jgi:hypothetical protein
MSSKKVNFQIEIYAFLEKERRLNDPANHRLEWDQDGQSYHYLRKWVHALNSVTEVTGDFTHNKWAIELARTAHTKFVYAPLVPSLPRGDGNVKTIP